MKLNILKTLNHQKGFSLLEVIVAILVVTIGVVGAMSLINYSISSIAIGKSQIIASGLAQEGLEIARSIRDNNWHQDIDWDTGLDAGEYRAQYDTDSLLSLSGNPFLQIDSNGYHQYDNGNNTMFRRKVTITDISAVQIKVVSEVTWSERGGPRSVSAECRLYNWK